MPVTHPLEGEYDLKMYFCSNDVFEEYFQQVPLLIYYSLAATIFNPIQNVS